MFEIDGHRVGPGERVMIVAEAGVNHGGSIERAYRLIDAAKSAGADCIKWQTFNTRRLLSESHPMYRKLLPLELSEGQFRAIKQHCDDAGITFLSTPDQAEDADMLEALGVPAFKVGSGNLHNIPFLRHVGSKNRPVLLSTGMGSHEDVETALGALGTSGDVPVALLHCASVYPTAEERGWDYPDPEPWNLRAIETLKAFGYPVGYSDHSRTMAAAVAAVTMGACIYEAHIMEAGDRCLDDGVSLFADRFGYIVDSIRWTERALGDGVKRCQPQEEATRQYVQEWRR